MKVLITGGMGYVGLALAYYLKLLGIDFTQVDTCHREAWVNSVGGNNISKLSHIHHYQFYDLSKAYDAYHCIQHYKPDVIIHLASQPSGPYSEKSLNHKVSTQNDNVSMLLNIAHACRDTKIEPKLIVTTTTGISGAPKGPILEEPMPILAGSAYHASRGFDSANLSLIARQWKWRILELRTAIVYGSRVDGFAEPCTRLDWDYYFGTVIHRFCLLKLKGLPVKIYGKGLQRKPIISLRDTVRSLKEAIFCDLPVGHTIMNQTTECLPVIEMAQKVGAEIEHIPNPRVENEEHQMEIKNDKFLQLLRIKPSTLESEVEDILEDMDISKLPENWESVYLGR